MNFSKMAVKRPITTVMLVLVVIAFGVLSIQNIQLDMMPNMNIPIAIVSTSYSGAGPEEIENLVTKPLEGVLGTVNNVSEITSTSSSGSSIIIVQFEDNTNIDNAALDMRERVDMVKRLLPDGANDPMVMKIDINSMASINLGFTSNSEDLIELKRLIDDRIVPRMERQAGVAQVSVSGGKEKEISVVINEERMRGHGISESTISQLLMAENRNTPAGSIKQGDKSLSLRVSGEFSSLEDIRNLPLQTARGAVVYLRDIAEVEEVLKDNASISYINGSPNVSMTINKQSTANTVNVSNAVLQELERIKQDFPNLNVTVTLDPADYIRMTLSTVASSALYGGLLALMILYVFLRNMRTTLVVAAAMPVSIIATFVLMYYGKLTMNIMTLGGLTLGIGMLVDNSIVVLESIYRKIEEGESRITASIEGAREVAMSVTASTLTTIAVFLPISFTGGLTAQIFNQLSLTITFSLVSSLVISLTFVPMACSVILRENKGGKGNGIFNIEKGAPSNENADVNIENETASNENADVNIEEGTSRNENADVNIEEGTSRNENADVNIEKETSRNENADVKDGRNLAVESDAAYVANEANNLSLEPVNIRKRRNVFSMLSNLVGGILIGIENVYGKILKACLRWRKLTIFIVLIFIGLTFLSFTSPRVGMEFMPSTDEGTISIRVAMPRGTLIEETEKTAFSVVDIISGAYSEIEDISMSVSGGSSLRSGLLGIGGGGGGDSASITVNLIRKMERERGVDEIAVDMSKRLSSIPGAEITVQSVGQSLGAFASGGIDITIKGENLESLSEIAADFKDLIETVPGTLNVSTSIEQTLPQATIRIDRSKASVYGISAAGIASIVNTAVQGSVATTFRTEGEEYDVRIRQSKDNFDYLPDIENILIPSPTGISVPLSELATISLSNTPRSISHDNLQRYVTVSSGLDGRDSKSVMDDIKVLLAEYPMQDNYSWEETGSLQRMNETFADLGLALIIALGLVYMIMAAEFESLLHPFIVMFSIPISLTGGLFGLYVFAEPLSITGFLGLIMLEGIVVNNAIVLVDYTNLLIRERGMNAHDALLKSGPVRMRPILMTTLTTVLAMIPLMTTQSEGSELMRGLAIVVAFGLSLSTLVTLLFVPVIYMSFSVMGDKRRRRKQRRAEKRQRRAEIKRHRFNMKMAVKADKKALRRKKAQKVAETK